MFIEHTAASLCGAPPAFVEPALESLLNQSMLRVDVLTGQHQPGRSLHGEANDACGLFHLIGTGHYTVESSALENALHLEAGDLVVLAHGDSHRLNIDTRPHPSDSNTLICGELHFSTSTQHPLSQALPACFVVRASEASDTFRQLSSMMIGVAHSAISGRQLLLNKLADTLFTLAICDYASRTTERRGLFAAITDTRICKVLHAVHEAPGHAWTMQAMASRACMSRSAFAERFTRLMKMPPMQYVTQWRVSVAEQLLRDRQLSVAAIAEQLGYGSEAAFRRLFKRVSGVSPGRIRAERDGSKLLN
ncbi:helix-turn-helix transcriptional regulator [Dyella tabacisoli]|uniref:AraC family transcriptional regulator n=1 Tax=Dyella tabacisoli TaxID=2282381 RepID=A0A369URX8_9GAMM|nr:AraC family transcriptional regulator [Dyella tabacisoli]RDD82380.1 AraC family transcriptional regulator [Dyella tabacisoli]